MSFVVACSCKSDFNTITKITNMKYSILSLLLLAVMYSCNQTAKPTESILVDTIAEKNQISMLLDSFNKAAANANFKEYFEFYTDNAIFTGTDATERWDKKPFMIWAKPFFDKGKAWSFTVLKRHIYLDTTARFAWFDELLNTQMKICRGSGVLLKQATHGKCNSIFYLLPYPMK